jgi:ferritin-like metal-binding protein YciE
MGLFGMTEFNSLNDLFVQQLEDLYDAEQRLTNALPKMAEAASSSELKQAFQSHLLQTEEHVKRLERIFGLISREPERETCAAMKGLIKEGAAMIDARGDNGVRDAGLIAAAQRVEHYEMAGYGSVRAFAQQLGLQEVAQTLQQTLDEEKEADQKLTAIAQGGINTRAGQGNAGRKPQSPMQ